MIAQILTYFSTESGWMPHGFCLRWTPSLLWSYVTSDGVIGLTYYGISILLGYMALRRNDPQYRKVYLLFCAFIAACGTSHLFSILLIWYPLYWLDAVIKTITAALALTTGIYLFRHTRDFMRIQAVVDDHKEIDFLNFILNKTPILLAYWDKNLRNQYSNSAYARWFNKSTSQISGQPMHKVLGKELYASSLSQINAVLQGEPQEFVRAITNPVTKKDILTRINLIPRIAANHDVLGFYIIGVDISDKEELIEYKFQNTAIFESISKGIVITDASRHITYVNQEFTHLTGYTLAEVKGKSCSFLQGEDTDTQVILKMQNALNQERPFNCEIINYRKDGSKFWNELTLNPIFNRQGKLTMFIGLQNNVTDRKSQEQTRVFMENIIAESPDFISMSNMIGQITYINKAGLKMVGLPENIQPSSLQIKDFLSEAIYHKMTSDFLPIAIEQGIWQGESALMHQDGHDIPINQLIQAHTQNPSIEPFLSTIIRDISKTKQYEQELIVSKLKAEQLALVKTEFLANMSHEIRTPMNAILGFSELALLEITPLKIRTYFEKINIASKDLLGILNDILEFSKMEAGATQLTIAPFNLRNIERHLMLLFTDANESKNNQFTITLAPDVPNYLLGDALRIQQILINLLGNAIKFTHNGSINLTISLKERLPSQACLIFTVSDTGIGMTSEEVDKILTPFTQADESINRRFGGTGLGLSISDRLLNLMDSELQIDSTVGVGSQFHFELHLALCSDEMIAEAKTEDEAIKLQALTDKPSLIGTHLLVVEDNTFNQHVIQALLDLEGITYITVNNGLEALDALTKNDFDLVLMDINMPIMDGYTASREIKQQARYTLLPIIALSAAVTKSEQDLCFAAGMVDFIEKPIIPSKLLETISRHVTPKKSMDLYPGLDMSYLKELVGNDPTVITTFLNYFLVTATESSHEIIKAINAGLCLDASKAGHKLKPSAYSVGAKKLGDLCADIEEAGKANDIDTLNLVLPEFKKEWGLVHDYLQARP